MEKLIEFHKCNVVANLKFVLTKNSKFNSKIISCK